MQQIIFPSIGAVVVQQILIFSKTKILLLGQTVDTGEGYEADYWCYFNPRNGTIIEGQENV